MQKKSFIRKHTELIKILLIVIDRKFGPLSHRVMTSRLQSVYNHFLLYTTVICSYYLISGSWSFDLICLRFKIIVLSKEYLFLFKTPSIVKIIFISINLIKMMMMIILIVFNNYYWIRKKLLIFLLIINYKINELKCILLKR